MWLAIVCIVLALVLFYAACYYLMNQLQHGHALSMSARMLFSSLWFLASFIGLLGIMLSGDYTWWCFIPGIIFVYFISVPVSIYIKARYKN